ncbi:hypothetical protein VM1G_01788 [Cytospora mali]|uniref:DNA mismatch repair protein S5 domain-containing protein n=1 Tax=Cytospora mali TaxID=578113 RepID=A0A194VRH3_CYTMA|nr:hypothetical protein VM1G_01788 [Valsa mali]
MPINPLPEKTIRLLGSEAVITTPVGLVKELLENAIDARATSIDVLISQNTVDKIEVRDNGNGIHPDDYECLGRPGHTSKLTSLEGLRTLGGTTLGFRGQALASANSMGKVTVTTRTLQDPTAIKLELRHGVGGVENQERTSAPVGTAVRVTALFSRLPVREQVILRGSQKNIVDIKHLLHAHALARPQIRLSFKVIGGNDRQSWSYSPPPQVTVKEAVVQVFGTGVMSQCVCQTLAAEMGFEVDVSHDGPELVIEAVLPKPDANLSKLSKGPFFSVDSRPITTLRGTGKDLVTIFRTRFKQLQGVDAAPKVVNDLFMRVNIRCSPGTYDPNIEPSKTQVLFANEHHVKDLFERLCADLYNIQETRSSFVTIEKRPLIRRIQTRTPPPSSDGPEGDNEPLISDLEDTTTHDVTNQPSQTPMSSYSSPFHPHFLKTNITHTNEPQGTKRPRGSPFPRDECQSPLEAVVMGSPSFQDRPRTRKEQHIQPPTRDISGRETSIDHSRIEINNIQDEQTEPATNVVSPHVGREGISCKAAAPPNQSRKKRFVVDMSADPDMSSDEEAELLASRFRELQDENGQLDDLRKSSKEGLNPWVISKITAPVRQPSANNSAFTDTSQSIIHWEEPVSLSLSGVGEAFAKELPVLRPLGGPPGDLDQPRTTRLGIPRIDRRGSQGVGHRSRMASIGVSQTSSGPADLDMSCQLLQPAKSNNGRTLPDIRASYNDAHGDTNPDGLIQTKLAFGRPRADQMKHNNQKQMHINDVPARPTNPPFRKPKRLNARSRKLSPGQDTQASGSPDAGRINNGHHKERSGSVVKDDILFRSSQSPSLASFRSHDIQLAQHPQASNSNTSNAKDGRIDKDPREYLIKRQRSEAENRGQPRQTIKRAKTDTLPLETIPQGHELQHLVLVVEPDTKKFARNQEVEPEDEAVESEGLCTEIGLEDVTEIEERLQHVLCLWAERTLGEKTEVDINLRRVVKGKGVAT